MSGSTKGWKAVGKGFSWLDDLAKMPRLRGTLRRKPAESIAAEVRLLDRHPRLLKSGDPISVSLLRIAKRLPGSSRLLWTK